MDYQDKMELKKIVRDALSDQAIIKTIVQETVNDTLTKMGMDTSDPIKMQGYFQKLEAWSRLVEQLERKGWTVFIGFIITVLLAILWAGIQNISSIKLFQG